MRYSKQPLQTFRLRNFKAVRDSGVVKFTPLTVFIGNNGSGKSSLIEGLETFQSIVIDGLDEAMNRWRGFDFVWNRKNAEDAWSKEQAKKKQKKDQAVIYAENAISFNLPIGKARFQMKVGIDPKYEDLRILYEKMEFPSATFKFQEIIRSGRVIYERDKSGRETKAHPLFPKQDDDHHSASTSILVDGFSQDSSSDWVFLNLDPQSLAEPRFTTRNPYSDFKLLKNGANIGDFLQDIYERDEAVFYGIVETMRYVVPYAGEIDTPIASELGRQRYLKLSEGGFQIPGWLLSTGTLRVLALLAVLRHPNPPPLLCIEEIENGLDPRTLNLLVEEIHRATQSGKTQVVCTTHSPYFLDLVPLSSIIVVERDESGQPTFTRPDEKTLGEWATKFAPGQLYTMSQLTRS